MVASATKFLNNGNLPHYNAAHVAHRATTGVVLNLRCRALCRLMCLICLSVCAWADGHGPEFGFSTATLGTGDASIETSMTWRSGVVMLGPLFSYGVSENFQISLSTPFHLTHGDHPTGRFSAMMPGNPEVEFLARWRFYHALTGVGTRNEATLYAGLSELTQHDADGPPMARQTGFYGALAAGHVTRRYDIWAGAGYQRYENFSSNEPDHQSNTFLSSLVLGWRPWLLDQSKSKSDIRFFLETTGERVGLAYLSVPSGTTIIGHDHEALRPSELGADASSLPANSIIFLPNTGGTAIFSGPTALFTRGNIAYQAGVLLPLWDQPNGAQKHERFRAAAGITYYFFGRQK